MVGGRKKRSNVIRSDGSFSAEPEGYVRSRVGVRESGYFWLSVSLSKSGHQAKHADGGGGGV